MNDQRDPIIAYDHTHLRGRTKKVWRIGPFGFRKGLNMGGVTLGFVTLVVICGAAISVGRMTGMSELSAAGILLGAILAAAMYFLWSHRVVDGMTMKDRLAILFDWWFIQPRTFHGLTRDREPDTLHWRVIVWQPTDSAWHAAHAKYRNLLSTG